MVGWLPVSDLRRWNPLRKWFRLKMRQWLLVRFWMAHYVSWLTKWNVTAEVALLPWQMKMARVSIADRLLFCWKLPLNAVSVKENWPSTIPFLLVDTIVMSRMFPSLVQKAWWLWRHWCGKWWKQICPLCVKPCPWKRRWLILSKVVKMTKCACWSIAIDLIWCSIVWAISATIITVTWYLQRVISNGSRWNG